MVFLVWGRSELNACFL